MPLNIPNIKKWQLCTKRLKRLFTRRAKKTAKWKVDHHPKSENAPTKIGHFIVESGDDATSNPHYNLFQAVRTATNIKTFLVFSFPHDFNRIKIKIAEETKIKDILFFVSTRIFFLYVLKYKIFSFLCTYYRISFQSSATSSGFEGTDCLKVKMVKSYRTDKLIQDISSKLTTLPSKSSFFH